MNGRDVEAASSDDHIALGTVIGYANGTMRIEVDHLEVMPDLGQRVTVTAGWQVPAPTDLGDSPEQADTKPTGDEDA